MYNHQITKSNSDGDLEALRNNQSEPSSGPRLLWRQFSRSIFPEMEPFRDFSAEESVVVLERMHSYFGWDRSRLKRVKTYNSNMSSKSTQSSNASTTMYNQKSFSGGFSLLAFRRSLSNLIRSPTHSTMVPQTSVYDDGEDHFSLDAPVSETKISVRAVTVPVVPEDVEMEPERSDGKNNLLDPISPGVEKSADSFEESSLRLRLNDASSVDPIEPDESTLLTAEPELSDSEPPIDRADVFPTPKRKTT